MTKEALAELMNRYPEVSWDRCAMGAYPDGQGDYGCVYGWIDRDDPYKDFLVIEWCNDDTWMTTSSAKYSREFDIRMRGTDENHGDCQRIEDVFGDLVSNSIRVLA